MVTCFLIPGPEFHKVTRQAPVAVTPGLRLLIQARYSKKFATESVEVARNKVMQTNATRLLYLAKLRCAVLRSFSVSALHSG
jgi:hypothetical protein